MIVLSKRRRRVLLAEGVLERMVIDAIGSRQGWAQGDTRYAVRVEGRYCSRSVRIEITGSEYSSPLHKTIKSLFVLGITVDRSRIESTLV